MVTYFMGENQQENSWIFSIKKYVIKYTIKNVAEAIVALVILFILNKFA